VIQQIAGSPSVANNPGEGLQWYEKEIKHEITEKYNGSTWA